MIAFRIINRAVLAQLCDGAKYFHDEHAVVGDDGAAALTDDGGVGDVLGVADIGHVVDDVVGVFLEGVVHGRLEVRLRAVVVHAQTAADVHELQPGALLGELAVDARGLVERALDDADVRDLAAEVEVEQLETVFHAALLQFLEAAQDFGHRQAELRPEPAR